MNIEFIKTGDFTPGRKEYKYIVIHWGATYRLEQIDKEVLNPNRKMSYHYALDNEKVHQYVEEKNTAWHCSNWDGNQRSIGVCINAGPKNPYTDAAYENTAQLCAEIIKRHPEIKYEDIVPHNKFTATQCPGDFDFARLVKRIAELIPSATDPDPVAPVTPEYPKKVTVAVNKLYVRQQPYVGAPLGKVWPYITKGAVITVLGAVEGQTVNGNNKWYKSVRGNYIWSGGFY